MIKFILLFLFPLAAFPQDGVGEYTEAPKKPSRFERIMNFQPGPAARNIAATVMAASPATAGKAIVGCMATKIGCRGLALTQAGLAYLYTNPEMLRQFLERHPEYYPQVQDYLDKRQQRATNEQQVDKYAKAKDDLGMENRSLDEQEQLEKTPEFLQEFAKVESMANQIDYEMQEDTKGCSIEVAKQLLMPSAEFNRLVNPGLPKINDNQPTEFNVDKYKNLASKSKILESDHIPSYKAMEYFFKNKVNYPTGIMRDYKLNNNLSSVNLTYDVHQNNRTTGKLNANQALKDANDLRLASLKDFATILYVEKNNFNKIQNYLYSFSIIYKRNKMLCLYDI